jgi:hypothetical protein
VTFYGATLKIWTTPTRLVTERSLPAEAAGVGSVLGSVVALIAVRLTLVITNTAELRRYPLCPPHLQDQSGVGDAPTSCALSTTGSKGSVIRLASPVNVDAGVVLAAFRTGDQVISRGEKAPSPRPPHRLLSVARMCLVVMPSGAGREFDCPADA